MTPPSTNHTTRDISKTQRRTEQELTDIVANRLANSGTDKRNRFFTRPLLVNVVLYVTV